MGPGSHVGFSISAKNKNLVYDHPMNFCQVWFKSVFWFQKKRWKCEIPIGSNVKLSRVMVASWISDRQTIHMFSTGPPNDHSCKVTIQLVKWFLTRRFSKFQQSEHVIGPGSHVEFPIYAKNTNLAEDHPMNMSGKIGWYLFSGFREEELNVKS
jgi:hypothetical protein